VDALLIPADNPPALADAIERLSGDASFAARIGAAGLDTFRKRASEETLGHRWRALIERVIEAG